MKSILRNILAVIFGLLIGLAVNMAIVMFSGYVIPPPEGVDVTNMESLKLSLHLFEPRHFIMPFIAHAFGSFSGALIAALIAANYKMRIALAIGVLFLIGGITNIFMPPSPLWFTVLDLAGAYIPMGWLGGFLILHYQRK